MRFRPECEAERGVGFTFGSRRRLGDQLIGWAWWRVLDHVGTPGLNRDHQSLCAEHSYRTPSSDPRNPVLLLKRLLGRQHLVRLQFPRVDLLGEQIRELLEQRRRIQRVGHDPKLERSYSRRTSVMSSQQTSSQQTSARDTFCVWGRYPARQGSTRWHYRGRAGVPTPYAHKGGTPAAPQRNEGPLIDLTGGRPMSILPESEQTNIIIELVRALTRDLAAYRRGGENYRSAGSAAVVDIDAALRLLHEIRAKLIADITADDADRARHLDHLLGEVTAERFGEPIGGTDGR
jgi:hypothetical protein